MIKAAIEKILSLAPPQEMDIDGRKYTNQQIFPIISPVPKTLGIETLTGMVDYIVANRDTIPLSTCIITVDSHSIVHLRSSLLGPHLSRAAYVAATYNGAVTGLGNYSDIETFIVWLQSNFQDDGDRAKILALVGKITDGQVNTYADDGVTQEVTAKAGITKVENVAVPNPVTLTPFRTFTDATQPPSLFVFRMRSGGTGERPKAALFEADGGKWKSDAIRNVKLFLDEKLKEYGQDIPVIA
jgi:hypothetical protein